MIKVEEKEKTPNESVKGDDKPLIENEDEGITLGDELLDKEFRRTEAARDLVKKHNSEKEDSQ